MPHTFHIATYASHQLFGFQCNILPCGSIDRLGVAVSLNKLDTSPPSPALKAPPFSNVASKAIEKICAVPEVQKGRKYNPEEHVPIESFVTTA